MTKLKPGNYCGDIIILSVDQKNCASPNFGQSSPQLRRFNVSALISIFLDSMMKEAVRLHVVLTFDRKHMFPLSGFSLIACCWFSVITCMQQCCIALHCSLVVFRDHLYAPLVCACIHLYAPAMQLVCANNVNNMWNQVRSCELTDTHRQTACRR